MSKINYLDIIKKAWNITWNNKYLWWLGLFLALGGGGGTGFNYSFDGKNAQEGGGALWESSKNFIDSHWKLFIVGMVVFLILAIAAVILKSIARGGLIKSVSKIEGKKSASFKAGFSDGKKYFWKIFLTGLLVWFFILGMTVAFASPVVYLLYSKSYLSALFLGIIAVPLILVIGILASFVQKYACVYLVLSDLNIKSSLESAFQLFCKNIWTSIIFSIILMIIGIIVGISALFIFFIVIIPFLVLGLILNFLLAKVGIILAVILGSLALAFLFFLLRSVLETFYQTSWVLFFREIASVKIEEAVKESEIIKDQRKILDPGEA